MHPTPRYLQTNFPGSSARRHACPDRCSHRRGFRRHQRLIPGAVRRNHQEAADWGEEFSGRSAIVVCLRGQNSRKAPPPGCGISTSRLKRWKAASKAGRPPSCRWSGRKTPRARRAGPHRLGHALAAENRPHRLSLADPPIRRSDAVFLFVTPSEVPAVGERFNAPPFDIENMFWSHRGELCTFDVMIEEFGLATPPLLRLAAMVRAADTGRLDLSPEAAGLLAASLGLSRMSMTISSSWRPA